MNRKITLYIVLLVLLVAAIVTIDAARPKPVNWMPTYLAKDKNPLGLYVFDHEVSHLFKGHKVERFSKTPYEYFDTLYDYTKKKYRIAGTFLQISATDVLDGESVTELLYFAEHGNTVFLSMETFPQRLLDTLKADVSMSFYFRDSLYFDTKKPGTGKYSFNQGIGSSYFTKVDTLTSTVLGYQETDTLKQANFIKVPFGSGNFLLHTQPAAFTNFYLLKGNNYRYAEDILSYIPEGAIFWHAKHYDSRSIASSSPLRYILGQPPLKWALYIGIIGLLVFIFFNAKRKQRIIPVIAPLKNTTVDFTKTIGNLYFQEGSHHTIIDKKIIYLLERIRTEHMIDTYELDEAFVEKLHAKTGKTIEAIEHAVRLIKKHRHQFQSTENDVIEINKAIENLSL